MSGSKPGTPSAQNASSPLKANDWSDDFFVGIDDLVAQEKSVQALEPTQIPRKTPAKASSPKQASSRGSQSGTRRGGRDEILLERRDKALKSLFSLLALVAIITVANLILRFAAGGRIAVGLSGAGMLFVFIMSIRHAFYFWSMLYRLWGVAGILLGILTGWFLPCYIAYFVIAGRRGNGIGSNNGPSIPIYKRKLFYAAVGTIFLGPPLVFIPLGLAKKAEIERKRQDDSFGNFAASASKFSRSSSLSPMTENARKLANRTIDETESRFSSPLVGFKEPGFPDERVLNGSNGLTPNDATLSEKDKATNYPAIQYALDDQGRLVIDALKVKRFRDDALPCDGNGDGLIDENEFQQLRASYSEMLSADHDFWALNQKKSTSSEMVTPATTGSGTVPSATDGERQTPTQEEIDARINEAFNEHLSVVEHIDGTRYEAKSTGEQGIPLAAFADFPQDFKDVYQQCDANGDGFISHTENTKAFQMKHQLRVKRIQEQNKNR